MNRRLTTQRKNYNEWRMSGGGKEDKVSLRPLFCRIGSKYLMADNIIKYFPNTYDIYVEPFVGGGGVFWRKEKEKHEVINDLDENLYKNYKLIKQVDADKLDKLDTNTLSELQSYLNRPTKTKEKKLVDEILYSCNGFSSRPVSRNTKHLSNNTNPIKKINKFKFYQDRMKGVKIYNKDYIEIMKKYDSSKTFFYLDPPYENSKDIYKHSGMDYEKMSSFLKTIKGKFLMSLNDSPNIRKIFKGFNFKIIPLITNAHKTSPIGSLPRIEILISNY